MPKTEKQNIGALGENIAAKYLDKQGYRIIARNLRKPWGELDIIAEKQGVLVFVEVKTLKVEEGSIFRPEDHLSRSKLHKLKRACQLYLQKLRKELPWRLDLISIDLNQDNSLRAIRHIEGIEI